MTPVAPLVKQSIWCIANKPFKFRNEAVVDVGVLCTLWSCQNVCDALSYLLDNIHIRFGTKLYRQIVGIPMGTNCAPLVADLFLYCYERDFMDSLNHDNQADVIEAFNSTSRYLDDLLNIDNPYFEGIEQLNKASISVSQYYRSPLFRSTSLCCKWICFF